MVEEWPYVSNKDQYVMDLEKDLKKTKSQLYQTLINANKTVNEIQELQEQMNRCKIENAKLKRQIEDLTKQFNGKKQDIDKNSNKEKQFYVKKKKKV